MVARRKAGKKGGKVGGVKAPATVSLTLENRQEVAEVLMALATRIGDCDALFKNLMKKGQKPAAEKVAESISRIRGIQTRLEETAEISPSDRVSLDAPTEEGDEDADDEAEFDDFKDEEDEEEDD